MAYGNWGAFVYKNGVRESSREDNTPYKEEEFAPGYYQAFFHPDKEMGPHHASLGSGPIRLCGYKSWPRLYWEGKEVDMKPYQKGKNAGTDEWYFHESDGIQGELNGYMFSATPEEDPESVHLELVEPDGTMWTSKCGYCIGAGHQD